MYSGKIIEPYIRLFGNARKMRGEVKFVIKSDSPYFCFFAIFNWNTVRYEICLKFILNGSFLIFMWLTAEKDNLVQLYGWTIPYTWSPVKQHPEAEL